MKTRSGTENISEYPNGDWWKGSGPRERTKHIDFKPPFKEPPAVMAALSLLDASKRDNVRINVEARNVTKSSFDLHISTWGGTGIASVTASWIAVGE